MGWPTPPDLWGGGFAYGMAGDLLALGTVTGLDYTHPETDPHMLFQKWKTHPFIAGLLAGGEIVAYGAKTISEGGYYTMPRLYADGVLGRRAPHSPIPCVSGHPPGDEVGHAGGGTLLDARRRRHQRCRAGAARFAASWACAELHRVRNFAKVSPAAWTGSTRACRWHGGRGASSAAASADHTHAPPSGAGRRAGAALWRWTRSSRSKLSDVYLSGIARRRSTCL
jgi:electron-transferring-flavoprotein dehydrogenase